MKKEDVQEGIIRVLIVQDYGFAALLKRTEEWLRMYKEKDYRLHDDVLNDALSGILNKSVYKVPEKNTKRLVYRLAPQRKEENLSQIETFVEDVSRNLKKIGNRDAGVIQAYVDHAVKSLTQLHKKLLVRKHFADKETSKRINSILGRIDMVIAEGIALLKKKAEERLPNLRTSLEHMINMEYLGPSYTCGPYFSSDMSPPSYSQPPYFPKY